MALVGEGETESRILTMKPVREKMLWGALAQRLVSASLPRMTSLLPGMISMPQWPRLTQSRACGETAAVRLAFRSTVSSRVSLHCPFAFCRRHRFPRQIWRSVGRARDPGGLCGQHVERAAEVAPMRLQGAAIPAGQGKSRPAEGRFDIVFQALLVVLERKNIAAAAFDDFRGEAMFAKRSRRR